MGSPRYARLALLRLPPFSYGGDRSLAESPDDAPEPQKNRKRFPEIRRWLFAPFFKMAPEMPELPSASLSVRLPAALPHIPRIRIQAPIIARPLPAAAEPNLAHLTAHPHLAVGLVGIF